MPIIGSAWFSIGSFLLFNSVVNYLPDADPNVAASVLAGNDFFRSVFGAGSPLFATECIPNWGLHGRVRFWDFCRFCSSLSVSYYTR
ncbi:hypothetical protein CSPX01_11797 [Colletotrichum filicis]|nr:hypothetical protein CSPX01_11797 [Colletotrichum filicis]